MWWWEQLAAALLWLGERIAAVAQRLNEAARIRPGNHPAPVVVSSACRCRMRGQRQGRQL
jgi:hypothetical protein